MFAALFKLGGSHDAEFFEKAGVVGAGTPVRGEHFVVEGARRVA